MASTESKRFFVRISPEPLQWIRDRSEPGGLFASDNHAFTLALARLRFEQEFIRAECKREGLRYSEETFVQLYQDHVEAAKPNVPHRPRLDGSSREEWGDKERTSIGLDPALRKWVEHESRNGRIFRNVSHAAEVAVRNLQSLEPDPKHRAVGQGFPFDGASLWAHYKKLAKSR